MKAFVATLFVVTACFVACEGETLFPANGVSVGILRRIFPGMVYQIDVPYNFSRSFYVEVPQGNNLNVQVIRTSFRNRSPFNNTAPSAGVCHNAVTWGVCSESSSTYHSFYLWDNQMPANRQVNVSLHAYDIGSQSTFSVYVCVGRNATLPKCVQKCTTHCEHGTCSEYIDACMCQAGYSGLRCNLHTGHHTHDDSSFFADFEIFFGVISLFISLIASIVIVVAFCMLFIFCCFGCHSCLSRCCRKKGTVLSRQTVPTNAPPGYVFLPQMARTNAYVPLTTIPPPPPPPMASASVEMATPGYSTAQNTGAVYIMPPLAPVKQLPVFVQIPVPKN